ncbi:hypothetical protein [Thermoanaerobacterium sp. DL9XJH110]|uniref:hypothetical protein n=1 Tax=Thermoanaerobacterium sp. DL9XJH110 TaxID=3386643 RepID=UPI003BB75F63
MNIPSYKRYEGEFSYLIIRAEDMHPNMFRKPIQEQISLFPTIEDEIYQDMPKYLKRYSRHKTRIKNIAKKYNIDGKTAKKYYKAAYHRFVYELNYKHFMRNKEYFEWLHTPEAEEYIRQYIQECDEQTERYKKEFEQRIRDGKEHVVSLEVEDPEVEKLLDNPFYADIIYHGPFSALIQNPGITEHDARILLARGYIKIEQGDPDTILQYDFPPKKDENPNRFYCINCGAELDYNDIGINKKLGAKDERFYKCPRCMGLKDEEKESMVRFYRSNGCNLFI